MGQHYDANKIPKFGMKIDGYYSADIELYHIVAIINNGHVQVALDVTERNEYDKALKEYSDPMCYIELYEVATGQIFNLYSADLD